MVVHDGIREFEQVAEKYIYSLGATLFVSTFTVGTVFMFNKITALLRSRLWLSIQSLYPRVYSKDVHAVL
jgi:hypothetical protein